MYVLPDPYAATYDTASIEASVLNLELLINSITEEEWGMVSLNVITVHEVECNFKEDVMPKATPGYADYTIYGKTDVEAYVYCWGAK